MRTVERSTLLACVFATCLAGACDGDDGATVPDGGPSGTEAGSGGGSSGASGGRSDTGPATGGAGEPREGGSSGGATGVGGTAGAGGAGAGGAGAGGAGGTDNGGSAGTGGSRELPDGGPGSPDAADGGATLSDFRLLKDLRTTSTESSQIRAGYYDLSAAEPFVKYGGAVYYAGADATHGIELFRTDGTAGGTRLVKDIEPGPGSSAPYEPTTAAGFLFFSTRPGTSYPGVVWRTDGTEAGTLRIGGSAISRSGTPHALFFSDFCWRNIPCRYQMSRGTPGDVSYLGTFDSGIGGVVSAPSFALFNATRVDHQSGVWRTDGTEAGTVLLPDQSSRPSGFAALGDRIYAFGSIGANAGLFLMDPTGTTAAPVVDLGVRGGVYVSATFRERLVFPVWGNGTTLGLWVSDGTALGTRKVNDGGISRLDHLVSSADTLFFFNERTSEPGTFELWQTDGTTDAVPLGTVPSEPGWLAARGSELYFVRDGSIYVASLSAGIRRLTTAADLDPQYLLGTADRVYFTAHTKEHGVEPWVTDGTAAGTKELVDLNTASSSSPSKVVRLSDGGAVIAAKDDTSDVTVLHRTTADGASTELVYRPAAGEPGFEAPIAAAGELFLFRHSQPEPNPDLVYALNMTTKVVRVVENPGFVVEGEGATIGDHVVFFAKAGNAREVYTVPVSQLAGTAPTLSGATPLWQSTNGGVYEFFGCMTHAGRHYCAVETLGSSFGRHLLQTDGTPGGTKSVLPDGFVLDGGLPVAVQGRLYVGASDLAGSIPSGGALRLDGAGQPPVPVPWPAGLRGDFATAVAMGDALYFIGRDDVHGDEMWRLSNDTVELVADTVSGEDSAIGELAAVGGRLYFRRWSSTDERFDYWISDGTAAGTHRMSELSPGVEYLSPKTFFSRGGFTYFLGSRNGLALLYRAALDGTRPALVEGLWDVGVLADTPEATYLRITDAQHGSEPWIAR